MDLIKTFTDATSTNQNESSYNEIADAKQESQEIIPSPPVAEESAFIVNKELRATTPPKITPDPGPPLDFSESAGDNAAIITPSTEDITPIASIFCGVQELLDARPDGNMLSSQLTELIKTYLGLNATKISPSTSKQIDVVLEAFDMLVSGYMYGFFMLTASEFLPPEDSSNFVLASLQRFRQLVNMYFLDLVTLPFNI